MGRKKGKSPHSNQISTDELGELSAQINESLQFEQMMSEISATYINLPANEIDNKIEYGLQRIGQFLEADRCVLYQLSKDKNTFRPNLVWANKGIDQIPTRLLSAKNLQYLFDKWLNEEVVQIYQPDELPDTAIRLKDLLQQLKVKSHLSVPFSAGGSIFGAIVLVTVKGHRSWPDVLVQRLQLIGRIFANALMRKQAELKLQKAFSEIKRLNDRLEADYDYLSEEIKTVHNFEEIVGQSKSLKKVFKEIEQVAPTDTTTLILGETGTGKELVARALHNASQRKDRPLVKVDCTTLPSNLIESELFGHEKGAYTGAQTRQVGRFELADCATIFLDEIGDLPLDLQPKLLRVLQDGAFERLGGGHTVKTNVRVIAATNRNLEETVKKGQFREDLWYRLNVFPITLPPLRKRTADIPLLVDWFVKKYSAKLGKSIEKIPNDVLTVLKNYSWPGNVRELENIIERSIITSTKSTLVLTDNLNLSPAKKSLKKQEASLASMEREYILDILEQCGWKIEGPNGAAEVLELNPGTLRYRMKKLGIKKGYSAK
jgi:formate hydrogenlyase transcriptional activator